MNIEFVGGSYLYSKKEIKLCYKQTILIRSFLIPGFGIKLYLKDIKLTGLKLRFVALLLGFLKFPKICIALLNVRERRDNGLLITLVPIVL